MKKVKKVLRLLVLVIVLILAFCGVPIIGNFLNDTRERYMDNEIRTERVDKKDDEENEENENLTNG
jgi:hypothetical protein